MKLLQASVIGTGDTFNPVEFPWEKVAHTPPIHEPAAAVVSQDCNMRAVIEKLCDEHQRQAATLVTSVIQVL